MDLTFNPDFSQIESDRQQIEVNQRFPLFYAELRPFFVEGQEIFQLPAPVRFVHTRTIVDPQYGAKLTDKVGRAAVGVIVANDEGPGHVDDRADPAYGRKALFVLGRLRYDLYSESSVGLLVTNREFLDRSNRVAGADAQFRLGPTHRLLLRAFGSETRREGNRSSGPMIDVGLRREARTLSYGVFHNQIDPDFATDAGFVQRTGIKRTNANADYRFWPQNLIVSWGPRLSAGRTYDYEGVLTDQDTGAGLNVQFARNIMANAGVNREMERFRGVDFWKTRLSLGGVVNASRRVSVGGFMNAGDQVRYVDNPFLGSGANGNMFLRVRPSPRLQSQVDITSSRLRDPRTEDAIFDVTIFRAQTTYQFTPRLLARNILERNTFDRTLGINLLLTYRVNAGTVFYAGYDDRFRDGATITDLGVPGYLRTNRAIFTKLQYLFRY